MKVLEVVLPGPGDDDLISLGHNSEDREAPSPFTTASSAGSGKLRRDPPRRPTLPTPARAADPGAGGPERRHPRLSAPGHLRRALRERCRVALPGRWRVIGVQRRPVRPSPVPARLWVPRGRLLARLRGERP